MHPSTVVETEHWHPGYPCRNIAVNITMVNRRKGWPKQKPQATSTDHSSMFSMHGRIFTTSTCLNYIKLLAKTPTIPPREDALRLFPIGTPVVMESSSRVLSVQGYDPASRIGGVQYDDNDREKMARQEVHRMTRSTLRPYPGAYLLVTSRW